MQPTNCRIPLRYIQQFAGEHTSRYNPENPSGFYELYINGAQPRRYESKEAPCLFKLIFKEVETLKKSLKAKRQETKEKPYPKHHHV